MVCILVGTLAVALLYPPNNWDSMTYHMSRVMHWIGDHDIGYYPTSNIRQLYMMPLAEYAILHLQVLCGSDLYANLVQWFSFLVAICLAIKIAAEFGLSGKQQLVSGLMAATLPMAILQASSTQNDLVVSSFIMAFGFFLLRIHRDNRFSDYVFLSLAFGMALFTKGTAYVYCATIGLALGLPIIIKYRRMRASLFKVITGFSLVILVALVMNAGFFSRNYSFIGKPFPSGSGLYFNAKMTPYLFFSNLIRNAALHMGSKNPRFNHAVSIGIKKMLGSQLNDPNISFLDFKLNNVEFSRHEDLAGNLIHMLIASAALLVIPLLWVKGYYRNVIGYSCGVFLGFVLFCLLLRWQPWHSRLQTPLFLMAAPILAITVSSWKNKFAKPVTVLIVAVLFLHSVQFVFNNQSRSLVSMQWFRQERSRLYFNNRPQVQRSYQEAVDYLRSKKVNLVGLYLGFDHWEYPFWALSGSLNQNQAGSIRFVHVAVVNKSQKYQRSPQMPQYLISTKYLSKKRIKPDYVPVFKSQYAVVYARSAK